MIFNEFKNTAEKYSEKLAINDWTYKELLQLIDDREYSKICQTSREYIILDILKAASINRPIIIPPKFESHNIEIPEVSEEFAIYLYSSGSTGRRKAIKLNEKMLWSNIQNAVKSQQLTHQDNILTICSLNHTGGINAQTLAGLLSGSTILIEKFDAYKIKKTIEKNLITVTHFIPVMIDVLLKIKTFETPPSLRLVVAGSDCINKNHVKFFLDRKINFMINYGLTEAGPIIINHIFTDQEELTIFDQGVPLGTRIYCDSKIIENELFLKGDSVYRNGWVGTGDCVYKINDWFMYKGRCSAGCTIVPKKY